MKRCPKCPEIFSDMMHFCPNDGHPLIPIVAQDPLINTVLGGKYLIEEVIGKGGMGVVYKARHVNFNRQFAVKVLKRELFNDDQARKRFQNEANAAGAIRHPNAIAITDFSITSDGLAYLVMDLIEGKSLREIIKSEGQMGQVRTVKLISQVCDAVAAAHRKGIIHRDLKPDNIMVETHEDSGEEIVRVLDFGIAKLSQTPGYTENITVGGAILGSPYYMSPEQCDGRQLDIRSDIYSLGIILYEMLAGKVPFRAQTPWGLVKMHCSVPPAPLRKHRPDINPQLEQVVLKALLKDPNDRQQTATELRRELEAAISGMKVDSPIIVTKPAPKPTDATAPLDPEIQPELLKQFAPPPPPPPPATEKSPDTAGKISASPLPPPTTEKPAPEPLPASARTPFLTTPMQALLPDEVSSQPASTIILSGDDLRQEISAAKSHSPVLPDIPASARTAQSKVQTDQPKTPVSTPTQLPAVAEAMEIAEEFSLALPEMVEDLLISVSETITTQAEVLAKRAEAARLKQLEYPSPLASLDKPKAAVQHLPPRTPTTAQYAGSATNTNKVFILKLVLIGLVTIALLSLGYFYFSSKEDQVQQKVLYPPPPVSKQTPPPTTTQKTNLFIPEGMAYIPGGSFKVGNKQGNPCIEEERVVEIKPFLIDKYEVTNRRYKDFVDATKHAPPSGWKDGKYPSGEGDLPVVGVSWQDCVDYCNWRSKMTGKTYRLPTQEEWEFVARNGSSQLYPWGNEWKPVANTKEAGRGKLVDVGTFRQGENSFGMSDLIGNAAEWTSSDYIPPAGLGCQTPTGVQKVIKGGDYKTEAARARATYRTWLPPTGADYSTVGFRCVREVE
ncbi:MAG: SUMF1/EgtB/PvdO family nonheme iron enzyme [Acidobacteriota bacterium]|nr:SUMF1/EgtB/PvdO family nonheme iron enzyme [Blastocatellia bacterium]MDW8411216.1 SUMF1/EgtB/PvdO family nonheme iron enzyme [Acidobacteriota bacterium]